MVSGNQIRTGDDNELPRWQKIHYSSVQAPKMVTVQILKYWETQS